MRHTITGLKFMYLQTQAAICNAPDMAVCKVAYVVGGFDMEFKVNFRSNHM